jgi:hypothetical protein
MLYVVDRVGFENLQIDGVLGLAPKPVYAWDPDVFMTNVYE